LKAQKPFALYLYTTCEAKKSKKRHNFEEFSRTMILTSGNDCNQLKSSGKITDSGRKAPGESEKFLAQNTASITSLEFPGTDRFLAGVSSWDTTYR
jgi:hypothetical protein